MKQTADKFLPRLAMLLSLCAQFSTAHAQGALTPPGAPAATMKSLDQIEPRTPISSAPFTISSPGSYYLTTNLTGSSGSFGISINSGNVTLDLNGFTVQGVHGSTVGIQIPTTYTNLVVRNGTITGWGADGVNSYNSGYPRNQVFEHLTISANGGRGLTTEAGCIVRDCLFIGNVSDGLSSVGGDVGGCISRNNGNFGFNLVNSSARQCLAEYNSNAGFSLNASRALDCVSQNNPGSGIICFGVGDEIRRCRIIYSGGIGINLAGGNVANVIEECEIANNSSYGIYSVGTGGSMISKNNFNLNGFGAIVIGDNNNVIEDNHVVTASGVYGIAISSSGYTNNVVIKNVVVGGGAAYNYSNIGGANDFGPVSSAATATSPWANISH